MDRELLVKLLKNDLTEEEARLVKEWLDLSEQKPTILCCFSVNVGKEKEIAC